LPFFCSLQAQHDTWSLLQHLRRCDDDERVVRDAENALTEADIKSRRLNGANDLFLARLKYLFTVAPLQLKIHTHTFTHTNTSELFSQQLVSERIKIHDRLLAKHLVGGVSASEIFFSLH
jgi:hypothetical protein